MTTAIAKRNNYTSKKARQSALQDKINLIDEELKKIGVDDMKFRIPNAFQRGMSKNFICKFTSGLSLK